MEKADLPDNYGPSILVFLDVLRTELAELGYITGATEKRSGDRWAMSVDEKKAKIKLEIKAFRAGRLEIVAAIVQVDVGKWPALTKAVQWERKYSKPNLMKNNWLMTMFSRKLNRHRLSKYIHRRICNG